MPPDEKENQEQKQESSTTLSAEAKELAELKAMIAAEKQASKEKDKKQFEELAKKGELEKALEQSKAMLAEFDAIKPLAERWQKFEAEESKRLEKEAESLPESIKPLFARQNSIEDKQEFLRAFSSLNNGSKETTQKGKAPQFTTPSNSKINYDEIFRDPTGQSQRDARMRDPEGFREAFNRYSSAQQFRSPFAAKRG